MRPDHSSRSVPVLMPLHSMSTTHVVRRRVEQVSRCELSGSRLLQHHRQRVHGWPSGEVRQAVVSSRLFI